MQQVRSMKIAKNNSLACYKIDNQTTSKENIVIKKAKSFIKQQNKSSIIKIEI